MDPGYARSDRDLYEKHWWWRAREELILATLEELRPGGGWGRILDVGCGDGLLFERLDALRQVEGIETDPTAVTPGSRRASRIHKLAAHFCEALARKEPSTPRVPARPLNDFLYRLSRAEQRLLRRVPVPFGTSLLAVAGPGRASS